jgi:voltage-gated potassium channel
MDSRSQRVAARFEPVVLVAAVLTIPAVLLAQGHPAEPWRTVGTVADWVIWSVFALELLVMLAVVPSRRAWLREHPLEVAIVFLTPPFLFSALQSVRVLRVLRLLRLFRFAPMARRMFSVEGVRYAALISLLVLFTGAEAYSSVEKKSVGDSLYWAITTMTTVGYGDISPKHATGKLVACTLMLVGIGFIAIITGAIAQRFLATHVADIEDAVESVEEEDVLILREVRDISQRVRALESMVQRQVDTRR